MVGRAAQRASDMADRTRLSSQIVSRKMMPQRRIAACVRALRIGNHDMKKKAALALFSLAGRRDNCAMIAEAGGIPPLVDLLRLLFHVRARPRLVDASADVKRKAARTLGQLANHNPNNRVLIAEAGAIPPLVELLRDGSEEAAWALGFLAHNADNKVLIAEAGGIPLLVELVRDFKSKKATNALNNLARNNDANAVAVAVAVNLDALDALVELARHGRVTFKGYSLVSNAGLPVKRKAALVVAQLIEATAPRTRVSRYIKAAIGSYL
jgi:vacuolar protein 8